jgi:AcrR family transcriptional regulator
MKLPEEMTEKQRRVVEAAMEVFAEKGFAGASTSEIAKRAGVAEGTIFKQFKTKKELLIGVVAPVFFRFVAPHLMDAIVTLMRADYARPEDFLRALYTDRIQFVKSHERVLRIAMQELPFHDDVRAMVKQHALAHIYPEAKALLERFQARGQVRQADPSWLMRIVVTTFLGYAVMRVLVAPEKKWDDDREIELMVAVVGAGLAP